MTFMDLDRTALDKALTEVHFSYGANLAEGPARRLIETYLAATALSQADGARVAEMRGALSGVIICYHAGLFKGHEDEPWIQRVLATSEIQNPTRPREQEGAALEKIADFWEPHWRGAGITPTADWLIAEIKAYSEGRAHPLPAASFQAGAEGWNYDMDAAPKDGQFLAYNQYDKRWEIISRAADFTYRWQNAMQRYRFDTFIAWIPLPEAPSLPIPASSEGR